MRKDEAPQEEIGATSGKTHLRVLEETLGHERAYRVGEPGRPQRVRGRES